ncbi:MAG: hypothetical protein JWN19_2581, partial [Arthrobacter sp.]|nr:hypothetical protein [Arthrobacter sp.]
KRRLWVDSQDRPTANGYAQPISKALMTLTQSLTSELSQPRTKKAVN